jgi:hypothetical protein
MDFARLGNSRGASRAPHSLKMRPPIGRTSSGELPIEERLSPGPWGFFDIVSGAGSAPEQAVAELRRDAE